MCAKHANIRTSLIRDSKLRNQVKDGANAISPTDRQLIALKERRRIIDSLDLDTAMEVDFPNDCRWDYIVSVDSPYHLVGIEPHTAKDSEISVVIEKKRNAIDYLIEHLATNHRVRKWFWVSHGSVQFSVMERARKKLDQSGIKFEGRLLRSLG